MKIQSVHIKNFRSFRDELILLDDYTCFIGRNGTGKSTILHALNLFFRQFKDTGTDLSRLSAKDFHGENTADPIHIAVTFSDLSHRARADLADYARQGSLTITAEAVFDTSAGHAVVKQFGSRLGLTAFRPYFDAEKTGASARELKELFKQLKVTYPTLDSATSKPAMKQALHDYEASHSAKCVQIPSEDQFYGATRGVNLLRDHIQWVFVPASTDYAKEASETKDSALGALLARTVRAKVDFTGALSDIEQKLKEEYDALLQGEQQALNQLSKSLQTRLQEWAHPRATAELIWEQASAKAIRVDEPSATIRLGEGGFVGELSRFGHGMQRSYLLSLLQELSTLSSGSQPTLVMAIEEPELYQHPPQARHMADVLQTLAGASSQVLCCSHSPLFVPATNLEALRVVRDDGPKRESTVTSLRYKELAKRLTDAGGKLLQPDGLLAKLQPVLSPALNEMFFCKRLILVEGLEDAAHIMSYVELMELGSDFRRGGCHVVPVNGKDKLVKPLAVALELSIPTYVVFDADTDTAPEKDTWITWHKRDNSALQVLLGVADPDAWPNAHIQALDHCIWQTNITSEVAASLGDVWIEARQVACNKLGHAAGLQKNPLAITCAHEWAYLAGNRVEKLEELVVSIVAWAKL